MIASNFKCLVFKSWFNSRIYQLLSSQIATANIRD